MVCALAGKFALGTGHVYNIEKYRYVTNISSNADTKSTSQPTHTRRHKHTHTHTHTHTADRVVREHTCLSVHNPNPNLNPSISFVIITATGILLIEQS